MAVRQGSAPFGSITLDTVDREILHLLREDGRRSNADIARLVGVSQPTVRQRLDRITESGAARVTVRMNPAVLGSTIDVILRFRVAGRDVHQVGREIALMEQVSYVAHLIGSWQIEAEAFLRDNDEVCRLVEQVSSIQGVTAVETGIVARTEKFNYEAEGEWMDANFGPTRASLARSASSPEDIPEQTGELADNAARP